MKAYRTLAAICALSILGLTAVSAQVANPPTANPYVPTSGQAGKDVVWVPTPQGLVDRMLEVGKVTPNDYLIDLGSGDGRTVITAAKLGARAHGIEYNPDMVALAQEAAKKEGVSEKATFAKADIFESDFSKATIITLFLLPDLNVRLRPKLLEMKPGTRIVSNSFDMGDWNADEKVEANSNCTSWCRAFKWVVPAKAGGTWRLPEGELKLTQTYQMLAGELVAGGKSLPISDAKMDGPTIAFTAGGRRYTGEVIDGKMTGKIEGGTAFSATRVSG